MGTDLSLPERLQRLERRWDSIVDVPPEPRSVMSVIEHGLGDQRRAEVYVNRLLRYFLDADEPHGMGTDFLRAFLENLPEECAFREDMYDLSDVAVDDQVTIRTTAPSGEPSSQGYLDLLIEVPDEWFIVIELKFAAAETGTSFYCDADTIDHRPKAAYESGEYYLYIHRRDKPQAAGECFVNWSWDAFVRDVLEPFVLQQGARYPQRTVNQLRDFGYDIREITGMSDDQQSEQEKAELYIEYADAITDISAAFENRWEAFANQWHERLDDRIDDDSIRNEWVFYEHSTDWAFIFKTNWWRRTDTFEPVTKPTDTRRVRIGFLHRLEHHRDLAITEQTLKFQFRNTPPNRYLENEETNFRDLFIENFDARQDEIVAALPDQTTLTGNMHNRFEATYDIPVADSPDFFTAYITALHTAFSDHVIENPELVSTLDAVYEETLDAFR